MERQSQPTHTTLALEESGLENATGSLGFNPPAFQLMASEENPPSEDSIQLSSLSPSVGTKTPVQRTLSGDGPIQRTDIDLSTDKTPWDPFDDAKNYQEYNDIGAGQSYIGDVGDKIGTHGLANCCAIVVAVHIKCGKKQDDNRWVVGMHHFSGTDRRTDANGMDDLSFEDAYNDLLEETRTHAGTLGQEQRTYKVMIPGVASQVHFPAIRAMEQQMMAGSMQEAFDNDWQTMFNQYQAKSQEMQANGNPLRCTAVQVRPGKMKKSNLKVIHKYQPQFGKDEL